MDQSFWHRKIQYPDCQKDGFHFGEQTNMLCLDPSCKKQNLICGACIEEFHQGHKVKPFKIILDEVNQRVDKIKTQKIDTAELLELIDKNKEVIMQDLQDTIKSVMQKQHEIVDQYELFFTKLKDQVLSKSTSYDSVKGIVDSIFNVQQNYQELQTNINSIMNFVCVGDQEDEEFCPVDTNEIKESIVLYSDDLKKQTALIQADFEESYQKQKKAIDQLLNTKQTFQGNITFHFSEVKHPSVQIKSDLHAKSIGTTSGYKFATLDPSVESKRQKQQTFAFRMKEVNTSSNWIAIGLCHKGIIKSKNFTFSFSTLGHGAYMISSNGGTWSNHQTGFNNVVKAFKFVKGNVVICVYDPVGNSITFSKEGTNESYKLETQQKPGDALHPCCLFYYQNDEIEFINNYKKEPIIEKID